jgi:opacity protein-like surface antigen
LRLLFAAFVLALFAAPAVAQADDTTPADFSGVHLGLDIGYGLGASGDWCQCTPIPIGTDAVGGDGGILIGGEAGYGERLGPLVLEATARMSYADVDFADACPGIGTCSGELAWLGETFASAGVVLYDFILVAASVGYAAGDVSVAVGPADDDTSTHEGLMLGARSEFGMPGGWRMGVEYRHYDMSGTNMTAGGPVEIDWETESVSFAIRYEL